MHDEMYHYGVKNMRWGIRRYQNADGSLTEAGKKRRSKREKEQETPEQKKERILKSKSAKELYKNRDMFTDKELNAAYNRMVLERNIHNFSGQEVSRGEAFVKKATAKLQTTTNAINATTGLYNSVNTVVKMFGGDMTGSIKKSFTKNKTK